MEKRPLKVFEMTWCWEWMEKISWVERITKENVLTQVGETRSIIDVKKRRRLNDG